MRRLGIVMFLIAGGVVARAQGRLEGKVIDFSYRPVAKAKVYFKDEFEFTNTDAQGFFSIPISDTGRKILFVDPVGYMEVTRTFDVKNVTDIIQVEIQVPNEPKVLSEVIARSRIPDAVNDRKWAIVMDRMDVLTTAGSNADIIASLKTMPGVQQSVTSDGLFVRGGTGAETQSYIDGMRVSNFYYSGAPDVSHRGRFPPALFKGTYFSSGGYSAQYGQGLSGAIILETESLPEVSSVDWNIGSVGVGGAAHILGKNGKSSYGGSVNYMNLQPYYSLIKQKYDFITMPWFLDGTAFARYRLKNKAIVRGYLSGASSNLSLFRKNIDYDYRKDYYSLSNRNFYSNFTYADDPSKSWKFDIGISSSYNRDKNTLGQIDSNETGRYRYLLNANSLHQGRATVRVRVNPSMSLVSGGEAQFSSYDLDESNSGGFHRSPGFREWYSALFSELNTRLGERLSGRFGVRGEHSSLSNQWRISPRAMFNYSFKPNANLRVAYGTFYQSPSAGILLYRPGLGFTRSTHYVLGFDKSARQDYTFKSEIYYKKYDKLVSYLPDTSLGGYGYAKGIELFWRKKLPQKNLEYWISASYLDSKRKYADYPIKAQPSFVANTAASFVIKRYFSRISTNIALTYSYESGRPYYNPNRPPDEFLSDRTKDFHNVSISIAYVRNLKKVYSIFVLTLNNPLNIKQDYGYRYSEIDFNRRETLGPMARQFIFLGAFFSLGMDRTQDAFNNNL